MENSNEIKDLEFATRVCCLLGLGVLYVYTRDGHRVYYTLKTNSSKKTFRSLNRLTDYCIKVVESASCTLQEHPYIRRSYASVKMRRAETSGRQSVTLVSCMN